MPIRWTQLIEVVTVAISTISLSAKPETPILRLVPYPQKVSFQKGIFTPKARLKLSYNKSVKELRQIAGTCIGDLSKIGFSASDGSKARVDETSTVELALVADKNLDKEGYRLTIDSKVSIRATTADGLFWGTRTLLQVLGGGPAKGVPRLTITDKPAFRWRGLMTDNARRFHSIDFHIKTVKHIAAFKLNRYQIHFSDNESYTLPSNAFPNLPTKGKHYTTEQVRRLVEVARNYHVEIVPEIDVPGHSRALTRGIGRITCNDKPSQKLCIGREETYEALEKLFSEIMEMLPGRYWHLGADEISYSGRCKHGLRKMEKEKLKSGKALYHYFINRMHDFVKSKNRKMLVWEGFDPTLSPAIHKDVIVCPFDVKHRGHMPSDYLGKGYKILNTSWTPLYVADRLYMTTPEIMARWNPFMFGAGRSPQPFAYWRKLKPDDCLDKIMGAQMCSWAIEEKAEEGLLFGTGPGFYNYGRPAPRVQIMAERVWGSRTTAQDLLERVGASYW